MADATWKHGRTATKGEDQLSIGVRRLQFIKRVEGVPSRFLSPRGLRVPSLLSTTSPPPHTLGPLDTIQWAYSPLSDAVVRISYAAQATATFIAFIHPDTDLGTHNPSSFGAAVNSARMTSDTIRHTLEQASFAAKCAATFGACAAVQSALSQKRVVHAVERIADVLEKIEKIAEASTNASLAGNEGEFYAKPSTPLSVTKPIGSIPRSDTRFRKQCRIKA